MVGVLIRMKWAILRHTPNAKRRMALGWGLGFATVTVAIGVGGLGALDRRIAGDLLGLAVAFWTVGWLIGPLFFASDRWLRPEHLTLLPLPADQMAAGLAASAFVGVGPLVTAIAFAGIPVLAAGGGLLPFLVGVVVAVWHLAFAVVASKVLATAVGTAARSRIGMELAGVAYGLLISALTIGWFVIWPILSEAGTLLTEGVPPTVSTAVRVLPSGWGLAAVDAAAEGQWALLAGVLGGMGVTLALLARAWIALLARPEIGSTARTVARRRGGTGRFRILPGGPVGATARRELHTWFRDPWRALELRASVWSGLLMGLIPLLVGWTMVVPFIGVLTVLIAAVSVLGMSPVMEPNKRTSPFDSNADNQVQLYLMFLLMVAVALPGGAVVWVGALTDNAALAWAGVPVGLATGFVLAHTLGRLAYRRLGARGPELLLAMRTGAEET